MMINILLLFLTSSFASANCKLGLTVNNINLVWSFNLPTQQVSFTVTKAKNPACNYFVTFSKGGAGSYTRRMTSAGNILNYQLYKEAALINVLEELPDANNTNQVITGSFGNGANLSQPQTYYLQIPLDLATTPTLKPSGVYSDTYLLKIYEGNLGQNQNVIQSAPVTVITTINKFVDLSLVSSGGAFNVNQTTQSLSFGTLTAGASLGFDLRVRSNAGYATTFSSQNNQVLKQPVVGIATTVPYQVTVNAIIKDLSSSQANPVVVATGNGQTTSQGITNPVAVTIGNVSAETTMAGSYSDNITVTAITTE